MTLSDEKIEQLLTVLTESVRSMQAVQAENSKLNSELMKMLHHQMANQDASMQIHAEMASRAELNKSHIVDENSSEMKPKRSSNKARPKRTIVEAEIEDVEWGIFLDKWKIYKSIAELEKSEICMELRESCSPTVYKLLYQFVGPDELNREDITEIDLLTHINAVAVKSVHKEVHRWNYNQMSQDGSENISKYVGRLKAQAGLCDFKVDCVCGQKVSYAEDMISQRLVAGLTNADHQSRVISEAEGLKDLKSKVDRLITLETTDDATIKLRTPEPSRFGAMKSQYKTPQKQQMSPPNRNQRGGRSLRRGPPQRRDSQRRDSPQRRRCRGCGRTSHGNGKPLTRQECPANGKKCDSCGLENHFSKVCSRRSTRASFVIMEDDTSGSEYETSDQSEYEDDTDVEAEVTESVHSAARAEKVFRRARHPRYQR